METPLKVLIPISTGMAYRNLLSTDLHGEILAAGLRPVYLVPKPFLDRMRAEVPEDEADVDVFPERRPLVLDAVLRDLAFAVVQKRHQIATMDIRRRLARRAQPGIPLKQRLEPLVGSSRGIFHALNRLRRTISRAPEMQPPFDRWSPALVFSNNVFALEESSVLRRAGALGVPTAGMVHSWDNPTNKGVPPSDVDLLLVWSEVTKNEMTTLFEVPEDTIRIVGSPQFDIYRRPAATTREELLAHYGFTPNTKLILYATGAPRHCPGEAEYSRILSRLATEDPSCPVGLLIRLHPRDRMERYADLVGRPGVVVARAGRSGEGVQDGWAPTRGDHEHFAALMRHVDVVVNLASTMALDAAANDRAIVHARFDPEPGLAYLDSIDRLFDYTHTARLMSHEASLVARSPEELLAAVRRALEHPEELRDRREVLARSEGVLGDGRSAARIAGLLRGAARQ